MCALTSEPPSIAIDAIQGDGAKMMSARLTNDLAMPIVIGNVSTGCGCITYDIRKRTLASGESTDVFFSYALGLMSGVVTKVPTIEYRVSGNDAKPDPLRIPITFTISKVVDVGKNVCSWNSDDIKNEATKEVRVSFAEDHPGVILDIESTEESNLIIRKTMGENARSVQLKISLKDPKVQMREVITILTSSEREALKRISIFCVSDGQR